MFLFSGFLSLYSGKCTERQTGNRFDLTLPTGETVIRSQNEPSYGLNQEVIDTFPTFLYSNVKGLKIGKGTLACAVCLNEFQDNETLRLIPKCSHVYHHGCIDIWLVSHNTCPVCRANLVPRADETTVQQSEQTVSILMPEDHHPNEEDEIREEEKRESDVESPKVDILRRCRTSRPARSKSTGFLSGLLFPRSNSMSVDDECVLVQPGEDCERYTLRLPDEVKNQMMMNTYTRMKRAKSCVSFTRMSSGTWGYRTRIVGYGCGKGQVQYERFGIEESFTPMNLVRNGWNSSNRSARKSPVREGLDDNDGERSSDRLCPV